MKIFILLFFVLITMGASAQKSSEIKKNNCEIKGRFIGKFTGKCPIGLLPDAVEVKVTGFPHELSTVVFLNCIKHEVFCK
jgi:hypothetical protein